MNDVQRENFEQDTSVFLMQPTKLTTAYNWRYIQYVSLRSKISCKISMLLKEWSLDCKLS